MVLLGTTKGDGAALNPPLKIEEASVGRVEGRLLDKKGSLFHSLSL
jgi:hypothetical protein